MRQSSTFFIHIFFQPEVVAKRLQFLKRVPQHAVVVPVLRILAGRKRALELSIFFTFHHDRRAPLIFQVWVIAFPARLLSALQLVLVVDVLAEFKRVRDHAHASAHEPAKS